jgi:hypothetical protein
MSESEQEPNDPELVSAEKWAKSNAANLPPQFGGDPEKFIASYKEMRATLTRTQQENATLKSPPSAEEPVPEKAQLPPSLTVPDKPVPPTSPQFDWDKVGHELVSTGDLSVETRANIQKTMNVPDSMINGYISGVKAQQQQHAAAAAQVVGGTEQLTGIIKWAQENLPDVEREAVNDGLRSPGWQNVLLGLKARASVMGNEPKSKVNTVQGIPPTLKPFATSSEMTMAMRDPRYKFDSDYQNLVQQRVRLSGNVRDV